MFGLYFKMKEPGSVRRFDGWKTLSFNPANYIRDNMIYKMVNIFLMVLVSLYIYYFM